MRDLENHIIEWRQQMRAAGITRTKILDELESHLREDVARQIQSGTTEVTAFENARRALGDAEQLKSEFNKIKAMKWNRPLAWSAWVLFVVSFFLPAMTGMRGWQCAAVTAAAMLDHANGWNIQWLFLTLANLFMMASPFLLAKCSRNARVWRAVQFANFVSLIAVWSLFARVLASGWAEIKDLQFGYYAWTCSFLLLFLSTIPWPIGKARSVVEAN